MGVVRYMHLYLYMGCLHFSHMCRINICLYIRLTYILHIYLYMYTYIYIYIYIYTYIQVIEFKRRVCKEGESFAIINQKGECVGLV